jgi:hypothetical protein
MAGLEPAATPPAPDHELEARYDRRFASIDREIPPTPPFADARARARSRLSLALGALAAAIVLVVVGVPLLHLPSIVSPLASGSPGTTAGIEPDFSFKPIPDVPFPDAIGGLRVISVEEAVRHLAAGDLDGAAVAVAGYYDAFHPSCPAPMGYIGPLMQWCDRQSFGDTPEGARMCTYTATSSSCHEPSGTNLAPFWMPETSGALADIFGGFETKDPLPIVLIGHAGDARQWLCTAHTQDECARAFVVDRIAWALGAEVPVTAPIASDQRTYAQLTPSLSLALVIAPVGDPSTVLSAAAFRARDIAMIDPRSPMGGENLIWLVRALSDPVFTSLTSNPARAEVVWLVDDATGKVLDHYRMRLEPTYQPARVWPSARIDGFGCCGGDLVPFLRVESAAGDVVAEAPLSGTASGDGDTTSFGGYGSNVLVLAPGRYTVSSWVASFYGGLMGIPAQQCSADFTLEALESTGLIADFPKGKPCSLKPTAAPTGAP